MHKFLRPLLLLPLLAAPGLAQNPVVNRWLGGFGNWNNNAKWSLGVAPDGSTVILIPNATDTVRQDVPVTISVELINRGFLLGNTGQYLFNKGTLRNFGVLTNVSGVGNDTGGILINMRGAALVTTSLDNDGDLRNGGRLTAVAALQNNGSVTNAGDFTVGVTGRLFSFENDGTITNYGVLTIDTTASGLALISSGTLINMPGATLTALGAVLIQIPGSMSNAGTFNSLGGLINSSSLLINSGTLTNRGRLSNLGLGVLTNSGTLSNERDFINTAESLVDNLAGGELINHYNMTNAGTLNNALDATLSNTYILENTGVLNNGGKFENTLGVDNAAGAELINAGGVIDNQGGLNNSGFLANTSATRTLGGELFYGTLSNTGKLNNSAGAILYNLAGNTLSNAAGRIDNAGLLQNDGNLYNFDGGIFNSGTLENGGLLYNSAGGRFVNSATVTNGGEFENAGILVNGKTFTNFGTLTTSGELSNFGPLQNTGVLTNDGAMLNHIGGTITNDGLWTNASTLMNEMGAVLNNNQLLDNTGLLTNDGAILNAATATILNDGSLINDDGTLTNLGVLDSGGLLVNGGVLDNEGTLASRGEFRSAPGSRLINNGFASMSLAENQIGGSFENDGTVTMTGGNPLLVTPTGILGGTGAVNGKIVNQGKMKPGNSPGEFLINGDYEQTGTGAFLEEIAGAGAGQNGELLVMGNISLDGLLDVLLLNGFVPALGDSWVVIGYGGSRRGEFAAVDFPALPAGLAWDVNYDDAGSQVVLDVIAGALVTTPEPSTWALLTAVIAGAVWQRRRARASDPAARPRSAPRAFRA